MVEFWSQNLTKPAYNFGPKIEIYALEKDIDNIKQRKLANNDFTLVECSN